MIIRCLIFYFMLMAYPPAQLAKPDSTLIKKPKTAFYLSLIPGGGQLYNGKLLKGSVVMGLESLAIYSFLENSKIITLLSQAFPLLPLLDFHCH